MSFRVSPKFKALLEAAAAKENRSMTNLLETLLLAHCEKHSNKEAATKLSRLNRGKT